MYKIRQFKPMLYVLLSLGMLGYALAAQSPGVFLLAFFLIAVNAWLVKTRRFTPLPRLLANVVTLGGFFFVFAQVKAGINSPILLIAQFLVFLQIIKLWELRGNRDYAQLLVLSLLLMVAAAISTASLLFGIVLIAYLFFSLYCCLLFHLKVETDHAKATYSLPEGRVNEATLLQDQRYLSGSMRRLTGLVATVSVLSATAVFLFFPRGTGAGLLAPLQFRPSQALTGFSDQVSFQNIARIQQSTEEVARVRLSRDNKPVTIAPLLLRGTTLDVYKGNDPSLGQAWGWARSHSRDEDSRSVVRDRLEVEAEAESQHLLLQDIQLKPTGTPVLFSVAGATSMASSRDIQVRYSIRDGVLQSYAPLMQELRYMVAATGELPAPRSSLLDTAAQAFGLVQPRAPASVIDPQIAAYARRPEVTGGLASKRAASPEPQAIDEEIAHNIEHYLQSNFVYTLDLTNTHRLEGQDPMVAFLYDFKRGHCEYFAGAMTLICQSLKMQARMVVGFKCDEYNTFGQFFTVRQSHAHAWVEVLTPSGWKTFDPTSGREDPSARKNAGLWAKAKSFFDYLEYSWAQSVIAYDSENQTNLITQVEAGMTNTAISGQTMMGDLQRKLLDPSSWLWTDFRTISTIMGLMVAGVLIAIGWFIRDRWRLRRRATRMGIRSLPTAEQLRLARQLGFYDDMLNLLDRRQIIRPEHQTPLEFSRSLTYLSSEVFETVQRLTGIFYRVRFGGINLSPGQRRHLEVTLGHLQELLP